ncbi:hypothetical protein BJ322DRAFT_1202101 [Thelephora terrestris]|uniref:Uncharacterized protein n=1 Tax=Thelephora terrestris TaxID=56493 RepID=A0A9P6HP21_9AGAM|nr:hypothetical protein BJ322DRAFT_1202101 [Thelephora terrestris]
MIIIDEKSQAMRGVPPPYEHLQPPPFPISSRPPPTLDTLSPHLLLQIVHRLFPQTSDADKGKVERQRETLYYLSTSLRLVNRVFYVVTMHVLRSTYLPAYNSLIRRPYSSDPFPQALPNTYEPTASLLTLQHIHRETRVLDLFIALKVRQDLYMDDTEFHLENTESFRDLFDYMQPKSRLEDLILHYGAKEGVVSGSEKVGTPRTAVTPRLSPVPYSALGVNFSIRKVGLVLTTRTAKRTILEENRTREEKLESTAKLLVLGLRDMLQKGNFRFG